MVPEGSSSSIVDKRAMESQKKQTTAARAVSPSHGIAFEATWKIVDELEIMVKRMKAKQARDGKFEGENFDAYSDAGWSRELGPSTETSDKRVFWEELEHDYAVFVQELVALRNRADGASSTEEAFDGHMATGRVLYEYKLFKEALVSFKRARELKPKDVWPHFRAGNCLNVLGRYTEAKEELLLALKAAETGGTRWAYLLPRINVNLGIALEGEGMVLRACDYYRGAVILSPSDFEPMKLFGSALLGVGEYEAAVKALEEAIFLKPDYAEAYSDLASALRAMGENERAIPVLEKLIDLKHGDVDTLYNLGGLYMDLGRYQRASETYDRVLALRPNHRQAQLNKVFCLSEAGDAEERKKALKEALKMTNRAEYHEAISHLTQLQKKKTKVGERTAVRQDFDNAPQIRDFQKITSLNRCDVELLKKVMTENNVPASYFGGGRPQKSVRKPDLEKILRKLLNFLKPEAFKRAFKAINERILSVMDETGSGRVDLGMFYALLAPICSGSPEKRKRFTFDALRWRLGNESGPEIRKVDAIRYIKLLRAIYVPSRGVSKLMEVDGETDSSKVSYSEFAVMFDDPDWGFGIMPALLKLETEDRSLH